jgi:hypothetical protein
MPSIRRSLSISLEIPERRRNRRATTQAIPSFGRFRPNSVVQIARVSTMRAAEVDKTVSG